ncbi:MAG: hypothetical protein WAO52_18205 [Prolixibacteraceae bacterium]
MKNICLCFQIHHPFHYRTYRFLDIDKSHDYYDNRRIKKEITEAALHSYLPTNEFLLNLIALSGGKLKLLFDISGCAIDQFMMYSPEVIRSFRKLAETGKVGFTGGTRSHSIASMVNHSKEFKKQIVENRELINNYFGQKPQIFSNSNFIFSNSICDQISETGYDSVLINGSKNILDWRSPNYLYDSQGEMSISIFFRNEDISNKLSSILKYSGQLNIKKQLRQLIGSLDAFDTEEPQVFVYCNYLDFGRSNIETKQLFFHQFVNELMSNDVFQFNLPAEMQELYGPIAEIGSENPVCWHEQFSDSYYPCNELQKEAIKELFKLEKKMNKITSYDLQRDWLYLQTTDHFHLMDENHPNYQTELSGENIFKSKYDAFINYRNILEDFKQRINSEISNKNKREKNKSELEIGS